MISSSPWVLLVPAGFSIMVWELGDVGAAAAYLSFNAVVNLPHQYATWQRVLELRSCRGSWLATGAAVAVGLILLALVGQIDLRNAVLEDGFFYWGMHHLAAQHAGLYRFRYRSSGGYPGPGWRDHAFSLGVFAAGILWLHATTPMQIDLPWGQTHLHRLPLDGPWAVVGMGGAITLLLATTLWRYESAWPTAPRSAIQLDVMLIATTVAALASRSLVATIAGITAVHNLQYLELTSGLRQPRPVIALVAAMAGYMVLAHCLLACLWLSGRAELGSALFACLVAWHYLVDARIWRGLR